MPKSKEFVSDSDSEEEKTSKRKHKAEKSEKAASSKKPKTSSKEEDEELKWDLGNSRFVSISEFKGRMYVGIREYFEKDGELRPGKKGISLNMIQWRKLVDQIEEIDKAAKSKC